MIALCRKSSWALYLTACWSLAGCAGAGTPPSAILPASNAQASGPSSGRTPALMNEAATRATRAVLYVGDQATDAVYLFDANNLSGPPIGKITSGVGRPYGIAVDAKGTLYVANGSVVSVYQPGATTPFREIANAGRNPYGVAVSADGTLAVGSAVVGASGFLTIFDKGSATPTRRIEFPLDGQVVVKIAGPAIDAADDILVGVHQYPHGPAKTLKFVPGSTHGIDTGLPFGSALGFDARRNIYIGFGSQINEFQPGSTQPSRRIVNGLVSDIDFAVAADGRIFAPNTSHYVEGIPAPGNVVEYAPNGTNPIATLQSGEVTNPFAAALRLGSL